VTRGDAHALFVVERGLDENFRDRLAVLGEVVITERARGVGIVEINELPIRWLGTGRVVKRQLIAPDRQEILVVALLQSRGELVEIVTERRLRLVHTGNGHWAALSGLRRQFDVHDTLAQDRNCLA